jgi:hypothetical protein
MGMVTATVFNPVLAHKALTTALSIPPDMPTTNDWMPALLA